MKSNRLLLTDNWKEIEQAKELGIKIPDAKQRFTKILFRRDDVKRAVIDGDKIIIEFYDEDTYEIGHEDKLWKELEEYFTKDDI